MQSIIITGGAGFIGSHVVRLFVNKYPDYKIINVDKLTYAGIIDPELCEDCHVCQYVCPRNVIKEQVVPEYIFAQREALGIREGE